MIRTHGHYDNISRYEKLKYESLKLPSKFFPIHCSSIILSLGTIYIYIYIHSAVLTMLYNNLQITADGKEIKFIGEN